MLGRYGDLEETISNENIHQKLLDAVQEIEIAAHEVPAGFSDLLGIIDYAMDNTLTDEEKRRYNSLLISNLAITNIATEFIPADGRRIEPEDYRIPNRDLTGRLVLPEGKEARWNAIVQYFSEYLQGIIPSYFQPAVSDTEYMKMDIANVLIYNINFKRKSKRSIKPDEQSAFDTLQEIINRSDKAKGTYCCVPYSQDDIGNEFCKYSMYVLFFQWFSEFRSGARAKAYLFKSLYFGNNLHIPAARESILYNGRTFDAMMSTLSGHISRNEGNGQSSELPSPQPEDIWFLEKVTGISVVMAMFPLTNNAVYATNATHDLTLDFLKVLMECKPVRVRASIANQVSRFLQEVSLEMYNETSTKYDPGKVSQLTNALRKRIQIINYVYQSILRIAYPWFYKKQLCLDDAEEYLRQSEVWREDSELSSTFKSMDVSNERSEQMEHLAKLLCIPGGSEVFRIFLQKQPSQKELSFSNNKAALYSSLQTVAIIEAAKRYKTAPRNRSVNHNCK